MLIRRTAQRRFDDIFEVARGHVVARVTDGRRRLQRQRQTQGAVQLRLVARGHQHHAGQRTQERLVHEAVMHGAVVADVTGAVHAENHGQVVEHDLLPDLIEGALDEG